MPRIGLIQFHLLTLSINLSSINRLKERVPRTGLEPARPCEHSPLKAACLPISPPGQGSPFREDAKKHRD
jgi:hypothetical protein